MAPTTHSSPATVQDLLIRRNVHSLRQARALLERLDDRAYREPPPGFAPHRAGAHMRHVLEFYERFLDGAESRGIDYDARQRDPALESSRAAAVSKIETIAERLERLPPPNGEGLVRVRMEDSAGAGEPCMTSSICRELQVLSSHTIHHFALISMTLRAHGIAVDPSFGIAPSTLRHLQEKHEAEATLCAR